MRWRDLRQSDQVEDRRGRRFPGGGAGIGGCGVLVIIVIALLTGANPLQLLEMVGGPQASVEQVPSGGLPGGAPGEGPADEHSRFVSAVLGSTEDVWARLFADAGKRYEKPRLVLFSDSVQSACGLASAAAGPFYCPADGQVYLDLGFFAELDRRFGAPGDFAQAYVVAHEVGHHVQNLLGISEQVHRAQQAARSQEEANRYSVALELQADCLAGVWAHHAHRQFEILEAGDVEEGLGAAAAVGDDRIQRQATGRVHPESWTHGSAQQRTTWFRRGLESGDSDRCDPFSGG